MIAGIGVSSAVVTASSLAVGVGLVMVAVTTRLTVPPLPSLAVMEML